jgi:hypothetical protein
MNIELKLDNDDGTFARPLSIAKRSDTVLELPF